MSLSLVEAFETVLAAQQLLPRLAAAEAELAKVPSLADEKAWLAAARRRLVAALAGTADDLPLRSLRLAELADRRGDFAKRVQGDVVDALERLHAAVVLAGGPRAALLEALYYKLKIPALRKCDRGELEAFWADFEKRLESRYAKRVLADPAYAPVVDVVAELRAAYAQWSGIFVAEPASGGEASALAAELESAARRLSVAARQSRLLAQAALAPLKDLDVAALLALEAKKRGKAADADDTHPLLEQDPPDPLAPTPEERAELG